MATQPAIDLTRRANSRPSRQSKTRIPRNVRFGTCVLALSALIGATVGCSSAGADSKDSAKSTVVIQNYAGGTNSWAGYIAIEKGFFSKHGLNAKSITTQTGPNTIAGISSGSIDLGVIDPVLAMPAISKGVDLQLVAPTGVMNWSLISSDKSLTNGPYKDLVKSFKGMNVGSIALTGSGYITLQTMLDAAGLDTADVNTVATGNDTSTIAAIKTNKVAAGLTDPAGVYELQQDGYPIIVSLLPGVKGVATKIPSSLSKMVGLSGTGYYATPKWVKAHKSVAKKVQAAVADAIIWATNPAHLDDVAKLLRKSSYNVPSLSDTDWNGYVKLVLSGLTDFFPPSAADTWENVLVGGKIVPSMPKMSDWVAPGVATSAKAATDLAKADS